MEAWLQDWLSLLLRWAHFITGVAWIGASFYFNWLENHLQRRAADAEAADPIGGDLWAVHGGGFYYLQKYRLAPARLPEPLHWFKYEAYYTWLTGFALLVVVYYWNARLLLLDPAISDISQLAGISLGIASLLISWVFYHYLCRRFAARHGRGVGIAIFVWFALLTVLLGEYLSGRAAYLHVGAAIGTVMVANVFFVIIPAQKELVTALREQRELDPAPGREALTRSRHNNYLTLPVLFIMLSSHYPATYGSEYNALILIVLSLSGVGIRHYFNVRHQAGRGRWVLALSLAMLFGLALAMMPPRDAHGPPGSGSAPATAEVLPVLLQRCASCHAAQPTFAGINAPPSGVVLDDATQIERQAARIFQVAVAVRSMPPGNVSGMTEPERRLLEAWYVGLEKHLKTAD
jgi:uncharacterized membrane protein